MTSNIKNIVSPEHIRKIIKNTDGLKSIDAAIDKRVYIAALKYLPHAIFKIIETIPMPWEQIQYNEILYHSSGAISFVNANPKTILQVFLARWGNTWMKMRKEKKDRKNFKRMRLPSFDDDEKPLDYTQSLLNIEPLEAIKKVIHKSVSKKNLSWLYSPLDKLLNKIKTKDKSYYFNLSTLSILRELSQEIITEIVDINYYFLFNLESFLIAKSLNLIVPGGPSFEPISTEFTKDDILEKASYTVHSSMVSYPIRVEYKLDYPYLYNSNVNLIDDKIYLDQLSHIVKIEDIQLPIFLEESMLFSVKSKNIEEKHAQDILLPKRFKFLFDFLKLYNRNTSKALNLSYAPLPFSNQHPEIKRILDITITRSWYLVHCPLEFPKKVRVSYQKLLKKYIMNKITKKSIQKNSSSSLLTLLKKNEFFQSTKLDWVEAGIHLCKQGYNMLNLLIHKKGLNFLHLDFNFNLKPIKTLTTKERKKSRFGNAFHLTREILRLTKLIIDANIQFRLGNVDAYQLADCLFYIFSHVGHLTGIYRYKYRVMRQIRICKDFKHLIYYRFNTGEIGKGPGVGFWFPLWRVWVFFLRGIIPLLEKWLFNLLSRQFFGRTENKIAKNVTKQRVESHYDLELRASVIHEILSLLPDSTKLNKANLILSHLSEAWRCWKANISWIVPNMPPKIEKIILKYIKQKADWWTNIAHYNRERIKKGATVDKVVCKKNLGRLTRLYLKSEQEKQHKYLKEGPYIKVREVITIYRILIHWLDINNFNLISFPSNEYKFSSKLLVLTLNHLKEQFSMNLKLNLEQKEEMELLEYSYDNNTEIINMIKRHLLTQRSFKEVYIEFMDYYDYLIPVYDVNSIEKLTDSFLDHFIWFEVDKLSLFPFWLKPTDKEIAPYLLYRWCKNISGTFSDTIPNNSDSLILIFQTYLDETFSHIDHTILNRILKILIDNNISEYMTSKNNIYISYKDMTHLNIYGVIRGLQFSSFIVQIFNLIMDLILLGTKKANEFNNVTKDTKSNDYRNQKYNQSSHPIKLFYRINDEIFILLRLSKIEAIEITSNYLQNYKFNKTQEHSMLFDKAENDRPNKKNINSLKDMIIAKAVFNEIKNRIPNSLSKLKWMNTHIEIISKVNRPITFNMLGFKCKFELNNLNTSRVVAKRENEWLISDSYKKLNSRLFKITVSDKSINFFENRIRQILMTSGSLTFTKISNKWNTTLIGMVSFFREAIQGSYSLLETIIKCETKIQTRIKMGLNSKMPARFPSVVFYSPKEMGGLGLISMSHINIPKSDLKYSHQDDHAVTHFQAGMQASDKNNIPNIYRYIKNWDQEFIESYQTWLEYGMKKKEAKKKKKKLTIEDLEPYWNKGIPRINTLFQKDRFLLIYDKGWRMRNIFKKFYILKYNPFWWTDQKHDGKLWNLFNYKTDIIQALGGIHGMLEHTLFKGTYFPSWEGLFWEKSSGFEETMKFRKLTNAQRTGLNQIPNRRFTLWWSPTINRANVYIGFQVQLDLTGIFMHGKIPTLKISLIQIFRAHLWQKIHESLIIDLAQTLDSQTDTLGIEIVQKETIHPRKSYKMNSSCADIVLYCNSLWHCSSTTLISDLNDVFDQKFTSKYWIDIQLRWGDFDSHDIERYVRSRYLDFCTDLQSIYPSTTGLMIGFDLAYNLYSAYGNWIPGIKIVFIQCLSKLIKVNPSLFVLRERIRKGVQLYSSDPSAQSLSSKNYGSLFMNEVVWFVDDTNVYRVTIHKTAEGNFATKPINGAILIINPRTGQLFVKIMHSSLWDGHRRLGHYSKWKCAEEIVSLLNSIPKEELPGKLIVSRKVLLEPLEVHLLDTSNIKVIGTDLLIPFYTLMKLNHINDVVLKSKVSKLLIFNIYDNWLKNSSSYTAFARILLILRGLHINYKKTISILNINYKNLSFSKYLWPNLDAQEWINVEVILKDLIINDYCQRHKITTSSLTQVEIRDIILGLEQYLKPKSNSSSNIKHEKEMTSSKTVSKDNVVIKSFTKSPYERIKFKSKKNWKSRLQKKINTFAIVRNLFINKNEKFNANSRIFLISKHLVLKFASISDTCSETFGYIYGKDSIEFNNISEIICISIPPQLVSGLSLAMAIKHIPHKSTDDFEILGWIHLTAYTENQILSRNLRYHAKLITNIDGLNGNKSIFVILFVSNSYSTLKAFSLTAEGFRNSLSTNIEKLDKDNIKKYLRKVSISLSNKFQGFFLVPKNNLWNYHFFESAFNAEMNYTLKVGIPIDYFEDYHRPFHFRDFYFDNDKNNVEESDV
mmetsp:Transcript_44709/g.74621  ORF Transcript_44709/g.74621 Transcript_44709/m.74621 type:complete len:2266 (+) Transcript_44709:990-7787(+)